MAESAGRIRLAEVASDDNGEDVRRALELAPSGVGDTGGEGEYARGLCGGGLMAMETLRSFPDVEVDMWL